MAVNWQEMLKLTTLVVTVLVVNNVFAQVDYTVGAPYTSPSRTTCGAVNDCSILASEDHVYEVNIPTTGNWTFSLCTGSSYDTWLEVGTSVCANDIGSVDDFCGLQSEITATISTGTYYVSVEGWGGGCGNYILDISGPVPDDVGVISINAPTSACGLSSSETVNIIVENFGTNTQGNIPVSYQINGGGIITESIGVPLVAGGTISYTFTATADLSTPGSYVFDAWTSLSADLNPFNDSVTNYQVNTDQLIENVCIIDFIDTSGAFNYNCNFTNDVCADGYLYGDLTPITSPPFTIAAQYVDSIIFHLYYTDCGFGTDFNLSLNGVQIGTYTDFLGECICGPSTYPLSYTITDTALINANWSDTNTLGVVQNGLSMAVGGYSATIFAKCLPATFIEVTNDTSICFGDSVNLSVLVLDSGALIPPYIISWSPAAGLSCTSCQSPSASPTSTTTYTVTVRDSVGAEDSAFVTITVFSAPPIASAGPDLSICIAGSVQLNATGGTYYSWSPGGTLSDPNIANPTASPVSTTNYEVIVSNACGSDVDTVTVLVNPLPTVNAGLDTAICAGDDAQLNASGGVSYLWIAGAGLSDSTISNPIASPIATTTYTVVATDGNGCVNTDSVTVTVNGPSPNPVYFFSPDPKQNSGTFDACGTLTGDDHIDWVELSSVNPTKIHVRIRWFPASTGGFTTASGIHLKALHYDGTTWTDIYSNLMTPTGFTIDVYQIDEFDFTVPMGSPVGTHQIRAMLIDRAGSTDQFAVGIVCANDAAGTDPATGRHYDNDDVSFDIVGSSFTATTSNDTICVGDTAQLQVWGTDSSYSHIWSPGVNLSDSTITNPLAYPVITTSYIVSATKGGCTVYDTVSIFVDTVNFMSASPNTAICLGDSVQLTATGSGVYLWSPSTNLSCTNCQSPYASPTATTIYYVTTPSGCAPIDSVTVSVGGGPIIAASSRDSICAGDTSQLFAYSCTLPLFEDGFEDGTYNQWTDAGGGYVITATTSTAAVGNYSLSLTGGNFAQFDGVNTSFTPGTPDYVGFYVNASMPIFFNDANVVIGDDNTTTNGGVMFFYAEWTGSFNMNGIITAFNPGQWYHVEYKNVDFSSQVFDYYIDNSLIQSNVPFNATASTFISQIHLFNFDFGITAYYDEFIIGSPCNGIDTTLSYSWTPTTGLSDPGIANPIASPTVTTSYVVVASGGGCSASDTVTIVTTPLDVDALSSTPLICTGDTAQLSGLSNISGTSYSWSPATGLSCTSCPNPSANPSSTTTYYVTGISGSCSDMDSVLITVGTGPISPSCAPATFGYCCGMGIYNVTFNTINNTTPDGIEGYQDYSCTDGTNVIINQSYAISVQTGTGLEEDVRVWIDYNNDGVFDDNPATELVLVSDDSLTNHSGTITIPSSAMINTPLRMRVGSDYYINTSPQPCTNVEYGQFEDYTVIVLPNTIPPQAILSYTVLDMCQGIINFTDQSLYNPTSWSWDFGDGIGISIAQNPFYTYSTAGTYTVTLIVTNPYGTDTVTQQIVISSLTADFTVSEDTVDTGENVIFTDNSPGATTWDWDFGDGFSSSSQNTFHDYVLPGTYTVVLTVTNSSGCVGQKALQIVVLDCSVNPQTGSITGPVNVNASATGNYSVTFNSGSTYNWTIIGGNQTSGGQTNFITVQWDSSGLGQITVVETDSIGCTGDPVTLIVTIGPVGIDDQSASWQNQLKVYPNPNTGEFILDMNLPENTNLSIYLYNFTGQLIQSEEIGKVNGNYIQQMDLSGYAKGIYYVQARTDNSIITRKIIFQ